MFSLLFSLKFTCSLLLLFQYVAIAQDKSETASKSFDVTNNQNIRAFMEEELECGQYVFSPGDFPRFRWKNEILVENEIGKFPLEVKFFDTNFQQVTTADKPGRYGAVIEGITPAGFIIKRYVTLFCTKVEFEDYSNNIPIKMNELSDYEIDERKWDKYSKNEEHFSFGSLKMFPQRDADAAIFLAGLNDMDDLSNNFDTPRIKDRQWWITMKGKLQGDSISYNPLKYPERIVDESYIDLNDSQVYFGDYDKEKINDLREICRMWADDGEVPHVTLIVHKGKIIFHESFCEDEADNPVKTDSKMWMASITKLLTGVLMMQFVDQGIIDLDAPAACYLPELSGINSDKLTVRNLFTHTSGLEFAGEWASDWNYFLENQITHVLPSVNVGKSFSYHRAGYALAGKILERIAGRAMPYLFHDYIFSQLGMKTAYSDNTYGGLYCTASDLARLGQLLLNKGIYNGFKFFSEESFEKMLPMKLSISDRWWGIGTSPKVGLGLSKLAFGHGAASGTVFCIDPKNDLIIISARNKPGKKHSEFENALIESCTALVKNH